MLPLGKLPVIRHLSNKEYLKDVHSYLPKCLWYSHLLKGMQNSPNIATLLPKAHSITNSPLSPLHTHRYGSAPFSSSTTI